MPKDARDTLAKLSLCRTHHLGGRTYQCQDCGETALRYNSCGDRHCPQCSGAKRWDFQQRASKLVLHGVRYFQSVFTLPSELSQLALTNRKLFAELLPQTAWSCVRRQIGEEQRYEAAAMSVLHTWNQQLESHWHVHLLIPGEGPSLDGQRWEKATSPPHARNSDGFYLVDVEKLRERYRKLFLKRLSRARSQGKLRLEGNFAYLLSDENWTALTNHLASKPWVAHIEPPPAATSGGEQVVRYLTRYLTGGPISDHRIVSADRNEVTFLAREGKRVGGERKQIPVTLSLSQFVRRWCLHVQPNELTKTRYFGGWSNMSRDRYMKCCQELQPWKALQTTLREPDKLQSSEEPWSDLKCEHCGSDRMVLLDTLEQPSWKEIFAFTSTSLPAWYVRIREDDQRAFWDAAMGSGYYDWYLENVVESAERSVGRKDLDGLHQSRHRPAAQPYLPGLAPSLSEVTCDSLHYH